MLAKMATTLDVISGGRAMLGLGAAWNDVEHAVMATTFLWSRSAWTASMRR